MSKKKIFIDPGHGGVQPGACKGKRKESDDVLRLSLKVAEYLKEQNCEVKLSRTANKTVSITARCKEANKWGSDYFLSMHRNSGKNTATGNEIWVYSKADAATTAKAKKILEEVCEADGLKNRGVKKGAVSYADYGVNKNTSMPSALLEVGFISNTSDNKVFDTKLDAMALAIAKGTLKAVGEEYKEPKKDDFFPARGYFKKGDVSENVGKIAAFMRRVFPSYTDEKALGNTYGPYLISAVKEFQNRTGLEPDGFCGPLTVAMMEKHGFKR